MVTKEALISIKAYLKLRDKKQSELAKHLGISDVWMSRLLAGKAEMKLDMFIQIAHWLGVPASQLLQQSEDRAAEAA